MLQRVLFVACLAAGLGWPEPTFGNADWKPVTPRELALRAADIGDPEAEAAILLKEGELNETYSDGTNLKVYTRIKIFTERGRRWAEVELPYRADQGRIVDVRARTVRPDGSVIEVEQRDIFDSVVMKTSHGNWRAKTFSMPGVERGAILEYRYRQVYPAGFKYFALDLQFDLFTRELLYRIKPPLSPRLDLRWVTFNAPDPNKFTPKWDGIYNVRVTDIPPFRREPMMPPERAIKVWGWLYYSNEFLVPADQYWRNYSDRAGGRSEAETRPTRAVRRVVERITLGQETAQKIATVYDYVRNEINNVGYQENEAEQGVESETKPNASPEVVLTRRYGNSAEVLRLFVTMLRACGLDARIAELTTRDEAVFHHSFADSFQFNAEVAAVLSGDGSVQFYDPGTPHCPFGLLAWEKEGVTALIHGRKSEPFSETPLTDAKRNWRQQVLKVELAQDGNVVGQAEALLFGQRALAVRSAIAHLPGEERRSRAVDLVRGEQRDIAVEGGSASVQESRGREGEVTVKYRFSSRGNGTRTGKRLLVRPAALTARAEALALPPQRTNALYFQFPWLETARVEITPPAGYSIEELPSSINVDIGVASYSAAFKRAGNAVIYERALRINGIYLAPEQYQAARSFFDKVDQADLAAISFRQN